MTVESANGNAPVHFVRLSKDADEYVRRLAVEQDRSMAYIIKKIIDRAMSQSSKKRSLKKV